MKVKLLIFLAAFAALDLAVSAGEGIGGTIMPLGGLLITCFVGWYLNRRLVEDELTNSGVLRVRSLRLLLFLIRWVAPVGVAIVFFNELISN